MARYTGPKHKLSRRVGYCLWGFSNSPANKRPYPPGQHGNKLGGRRKESNYARHLIEKQKLRHTYGMLEKQFRNTYKKAAKMRGNSGDNFLSMLESRLDAFAFRAGFAPTIWAARQLASHGHFVVNGKRINLPSYQLQPGDIVAVHEKSRNVAVIKETVEATTVYPAYMSVQRDSFQGRLIEKPRAADVPVKIDMALIVEFYSR